nr:uncharacterized protein LOC112040586 [Quercus suber]
MELLQHFCHPEHPLVFNEDERQEQYCYGCWELIFGPSYRCIQCDIFMYPHHKSCAELPLGLYHPLHPIHPLILYNERTYRYEEYGKYEEYSKYEEYGKCELCKETHDEYTYRCYYCNFNLHVRCAILQLKAKFHDHPLTPIGKSIMFTCDICGKEGKGIPNLCAPCSLWIHRSCAFYPQRIKVIRHRHQLHLTHSSLEFYQTKSRFCQLCVQKVDTRYGLYYCSKCNFVAHLDCSLDTRNLEYINFLEHEDEDEDSELDESVDLTTYKVKKFIEREDGTQIATEIAHFSHDHDLKFVNEAQNNQKCNGCARDICPPFYSCVKCNFFLHESCAKLPKKKRHPLHRHPLTLLAKSPRRSKTFVCYSCGWHCNGFIYTCDTCIFELDVQCSLTPDILTHEGHEHQLILSSTANLQSCTACGGRGNHVFRCTTCEFALDFKCATLPLSTMYKEHEHPFTLCYFAEDDSGEYYCDICEEERDKNYWFYYCEECSYPTHPKCIFRRSPNFK